MRRIILDLEATGNRDTKYQRICEIGAIETVTDSVEIQNLII